MVIDPYFSATKIAWILDKIPDARRRAEAGELAAATVDGFLVWYLTGGRRFVTDATNASRTLLMDLRTLGWAAFWPMTLFLLILGLGWLYAYREGILAWK